ncbi:cobalamin-dependent protein [uncultured Desulfobacter sp.]|uniref:cobalamin B12-binding domain-containing protein n=1 Tax=uncultured Desulfobacter sp. TaxID=240139 RepID=UPI002AAAF215|nr:cobalamin-dependent protein [uncultured Desulfobacter sp.]
MSEELFKAITTLNRTDAVRITEALLAGSESPQKILDVGRKAMQLIGERFEKGEYFLPELMVSGDILGAIAEKVKPVMEAQGDTKKIGKVVFGTVQGDIHDIAKDIVVFMLDVNGFEVIDLGVDVPPENFVKAVEEHQAKIVGLSGFLTLAIDPMERTIQALKAANLTDVKVMVGGGPVNQLVSDQIGADAWGSTAMDAVSIARNWAIA